MYDDDDTPASASPAPPAALEDDELDDAPASASPAPPRQALVAAALACGRA